VIFHVILYASVHLPIFNDGPPAKTGQIAGCFT
jgi:hypothetical protein